MSGWEAVGVDDLDAIPVAEGVLWRPVRRRLGIRAFGVNAYTSDAVGHHVVEDHDESDGGTGGPEELYVVLRGRATFTLGDDTLDAPAGTLVFVRDPAVRRAAIAEEPGTMVLAVGGKPGRAHEISAWEWNFAAAPAFEAGRWDEAIELLEEGLRERPGDPELLYNLACAESRAGRPLEALTHLGEAACLDPKFAGSARTDPNFDPIRREPGFPE
jgi:tetratricopeptide (TPR) repeat protein